MGLHISGAVCVHTSGEGTRGCTLVVQCVHGGWLVHNMKLACNLRLGIIVQTTCLRYGLRERLSQSALAD